MSEHTTDRPPAFARKRALEDTDSELAKEQLDPHRTSRVAHHTSRINWPLWIGGMIVLLIATIAVAGPTLAPRDPMEENIIIRIGDEWEIPPFPILTIPGFPLGSDQFGRDLLSRLLWGVRPTMVMVTVVALVRLVLGITIGLGAGWATGPVGRGLDMIIGAALAVPVLIVALIAIAAVGIELGLLAFIIGLSVNGWVETARLIREQTQIIKNNLYIEASRALGASSSHILLHHVLRQLMPMAWMLFAFEISSTLMATAGLGFLGYYIGGDVWVDVSDFVARRVSGMPELGQMLASAWSEQQIITEPWAMIVAGSAIFITVLGFNLLGEGLRLRLGLDQVHVRQRTVLRQTWDTLRATIAGQIGSWTERRCLAGKKVLRPTLVSLLVLAIGGGLLWWRSQATTPPPEIQVESVSHLWAAERHDAQGTLWSPTTGPTDPQVHWILEEPAGFSGGPAIAAGGTLYLASPGGALYAVDSFGKVLWQTSLPGAAVGTPALNTIGEIYVADQTGSLSAFTSDGGSLWSFQPEAEGKAVTGPIIASDGTAYYPAGNNLQAVSPDGETLWTARIPYVFEPLPPQLSPDGELIFFADTAFNVEDGSPRALEMLAGTKSNEQYIMGADGQIYYRSERNIVQWQLSPSGVEVIRGFNKQIPGTPKDAGVTRDGIVWATFKLGFNTPRSGIAWFDANDQALGIVEYSHSSSKIIAVGGDATIYTCGNSLNGDLECLAAAPGSEEPVWQMALEGGAKVAGGALIPGTLYVATQEGFLYAIGPAN